MQRFRESRRGCCLSSVSAAPDRLRCLTTSITAAAAAGAIVGFCGMPLQAAMEKGTTTSSRFPTGLSALSTNETLLAETLMQTKSLRNDASGGLDVCKTYGQNDTPLGGEMSDLMKLCGNTKKEREGISDAVKLCLDNAKDQNNTHSTITSLNALAGYCGNSFAYKVFGKKDVLPMFCDDKSLVDVIDPLSFIDCLIEIGMRLNPTLTDYMSCAERVKTFAFPQPESIADIRRKVKQEWPVGIGNLNKLPMVAQRELTYWRFAKLHGLQWPGISMETVDLCEPDYDDDASSSNTGYQIGLCSRDKIGLESLKGAIQYCLNLNPDWKDAQFNIETIIGRYCANNFIFEQVLSKRYRNMTCNSRPMKMKFRKLPNDLKNACKRHKDSPDPLAVLEGTLYRPASELQKDEIREEKKSQRIHLALENVDKEVGDAIIAPGGREAVSQQQFLRDMGYLPRSRRAQAFDVCRTRIKEFPSPETTTARLRYCAPYNLNIQEQLLGTLQNCAVGKNFRNKEEVLLGMKEALGRYCVDAYTYAFLGMKKRYPTCNGMKLQNNLRPDVIIDCLIDACSNPEFSFGVKDFMVCATADYESVHDLRKRVQHSADSPQSVAHQSAAANLKQFADSEESNISTTGVLFGVLGVACVGTLGALLYNRRSKKIRARNGRKEFAMLQTLDQPSSRNICRQP